MSFMCGSKIILQGVEKGGVHWDNLVFGTRTEGGGGGEGSKPIFGHFILLCKSNKLYFPE